MDTSLIAHILDPKFLAKFLLGISSMIPFLIIIFINNSLFKNLLLKNKRLDHNITLIIIKVINITIWVIGIITLLGTWGVDVGALMTSLGLTGFALGVALKDVLSSIIAGILIMFYRPFKLNNLIEVVGIEGKVVSVDLRYTVLISPDGNQHLIPNSKLLSEKVTILKNYSKNANTVQSNFKPKEDDDSEDD